MTTDKNWQEITLGDVWQQGIVKFRQARRAVKTYSPITINLEAVPRLWEAIAPFVMAPILFLLGGDPVALPPERDPASENVYSCEGEKAIAPVLGGKLVAAIKNKPWFRRTQQLAQVMRQAWDSGKRTYSQLSAWVKEATGKGCSNRAIAKFVKEMKQSEATPAG